MRWRGVAWIVTFAAVSAASAQDDAALRDALRDACIRERVERYVSVCETADVLARGIAHACAPKPPPKVRDDRIAELGRLVKQAIHDDAYATALIALLDAKAANPPAACR